MQNPKLIPVPFANSGIKDEIPKVKSTSMSNEKASWEDGFPEATMLPVYAGGLPPDGKDFNGVLNQISENLVFQSKGGRYKFDPDFALSIGGYPKGATLQTNDESAEYQSLIDNNLVNFNTATSEEIAQSWRITGLGDATEVLNGKFDKASVKNELGLSQTEVVSQRVVTELGSGVVGSFEDGLNFIEELTSSDQLVTLENEFGKQPYYWDGDLPKQVPAGSTPQSTGGIGKGAWVSVGDASLRGDLQSTDGARFIGGSIWVTEDIDSVIARTPFPSTSIRVISRGNALFKVKNGTSKYPLVNPQINTNTYIELQSENGEITTTGAGAKDYDDTFILDQAMKHGKEINATVKIDCKMTMRTPLDEHTYIRLPTDFTIYNANPRVNRISLRPNSGSVRDAALCLESFKGLQGPEPDMCSGTVCTDVYLTMDSTDGGEIKVGHCLIGGLFRTVFTRPYASGFTRHNILLCRAWYSSYSGLFGRAGKGSGVTIGKHPDVNQSWDCAVNGIYIDEVWGHTNGQAGTWSEGSNEDIGYGVGFYGEMFSLHIGKVLGEQNKGAGFQNKMKYGDLKVDGIYVEANTGIDYYCAVTDSAGISWQTPNVFLSQGGKVKVKPDGNTFASLIGFPFVINSNSTFDFDGVSGARVRLSKETEYTVRNILAPKLSVNYEIMASIESSLNTYSVRCAGPNPVNSLEFANNCELVFIPYMTTSSTDSYIVQITRNGENIGTTIGKNGPFKSYEPVVLASWSGLHNSMYSFRVMKDYGETCSGMFIIRARRL